MLSDKEVAEIMKRDVPRLLHKRIAELEWCIKYLLEDCQCAASAAEREGYSVEYLERSKKAEEILKKEII